MPRAATAFFDGGVRGNPGPYACSAVVHVAGEDLPLERSKYLGDAGTNNQAEAEGMILALEVAADAGVTHLCLRSDSKLIVEQALGNWRVKDRELQALHARARLLAANFSEVKIDHVPREKNKHADRICTNLLDLAVGQRRRG